MLSVEQQNVNAEAHPKRVNSVGWLDEEPLPWSKRFATHKANKSGQGRICNANPVSQDGVMGGIGYTQVLRDPWPHSSA